jgi:hypothetical protein
MNPDPDPQPCVHLQFFHIQILTISSDQKIFKILPVTANFSVFFCNYKLPETVLVFAVENEKYWYLNSLRKKTEGCKSHGPVPLMSYMLLYVFN